MVVSVAKHRQALRISSMLSDSYRQMYRPKFAIVKPYKVIRTLQAACVGFVLMGIHGMNGYRYQPRATHDVDLLVRKIHHQKAVAALRDAFPKLVLEDTISATRLIDPAAGYEVIDLIRLTGSFYRLAFKYCVSVGGAYSVPSLEMALACKFATMTSPHRRLDSKYLDAGDFMNMVVHNYHDIDYGRLTELAETVSKGSGTRILKFVESAKVGRRIAI